MKTRDVYKVLVGEKTFLIESKLQRIWQHVKEGFFIISAFTADRSITTELRESEKLKDMLKDLELGFIELIGKWEVEMSPEQKHDFDLDKFGWCGKCKKYFRPESIVNIVVEKNEKILYCPKCGGKLKSCLIESEVSYFVPYRREKYSENEFFEIAYDLMIAFGQESIVFKGTYPSSTISLVDRKKNVIYELGSYHADKIGAIYSMFKYGSHAERTFIFEGYRVPQNHINAMALKKQGYIL